MRIVLTGATGLIGRNLLFEAVKQNLGHLNDLEIFVLGRAKAGMSINERICEMMRDDGIQYIGADKISLGDLVEYCENGITCIDADLGKDRLGLADDDFRVLNEGPIDIFFHLAASTDLRSTPEVERTLLRENINGTRRMLELASTLRVKEFCYTGTAYSCGIAEGRIKPDHINTSNKFRNPYEKTKLEGELLVRDFARKTKTMCRFFRPSVTCGRLIEPPAGAINKFDVFYGWAAFFSQIKKKKLAGKKISCDRPLELEMRLCYNRESGLNIVPADFAAKVMYQVCAQEVSENSFYLVNDKETPHELYISLMLEALGISGPRQADAVPEDMNQLESLYYKTVGKVFTPYITSSPMLFDVSNLRAVLSSAKLACPAVDAKNFSILMEYAKERGFGAEGGKNITEVSSGKGKA